MDPLSVSASIAGLLSAAGAVAKLLGPYIAAAREIPKIAVQVNSEVQAVTIILSALQSLVQNMASVLVQRAALVQVDHVIAVLTDGVFIFSELEASIESLSLGLSITSLTLRTRFRWARKETEFASILARLEGFKSSMSLILDIFQADSVIRAEECRGELTNNVNKLLENSRDVARRLMNLEDTFDARSTVTVSKRRSLTPSLRLGHAHGEVQPIPNRQSKTGDPSRSSRSPTPTGSGFKSGFAFEPDLEVSRPYRRVQRETMDFSFRSSVVWSNCLSVFSGLTFGDISVMSVIALPIYADEISNSRHYNFGTQQSTSAPAPMPMPMPVATAFKPATTTVTSLLHECLEVELQLVQIPGFPLELFKTDPDVNHPIDTLRQIFSLGFPFLMLLDSPETLLRAQSLDAVHTDGRPISDSAVSRAIQMFSENMALEPDEMFSSTDLVRNGGAGFMRVLDVIQRSLATRTRAKPFEPAGVGALLRTKRGYFGDPPPTDSVVEDFLAQERLFYSQLEDLPMIERQIRILNLLNDDRIAAIFTPLRKFMDVQLRFLLDIERNLLRPPQTQRWSGAFRDWAKNAKLYGMLIGSELRTKAVLRARLGTGESHEHGPHVDTVAACFRLVSLPALSMLGYLEFLEDMDSNIADSDARMIDIIESRNVIRQAHDDISVFVKEEDYSSILLDLKLNGMDGKPQNISRFGRLISYEAAVKVTYCRGPRNSRVQRRLYTFVGFLLIVKEVAQSLRPEQGGEPKRLQFTEKGRVYAWRVKAVLPSEHTSACGMAAHSCSCMLVWEGETSLELVELRFATRPQMQRWAYELRATVREQSGGSGPIDLDTLPVGYPKEWDTRIERLRCPRV